MKVKCYLMVVAVLCLAGVGHAGLFTDMVTAVGGVGYDTPGEPYDTDGSDGYSATVNATIGSSTLTWSSGWCWTENAGFPFGGDTSSEASFGGRTFDNDDWTQYGTTYENARLTMTFSGLDALTEYTMYVAGRGKAVTMFDGTNHVYVDFVDWAYEWQQVPVTFTGAQLMAGDIAFEVDTVAAYSGAGAQETERFQIDGIALTGGAVPEPTTMALLGLGSLVTFLRRKK